MDARAQTGIEVSLPGGVTVILPYGTPPSEVGAYVDSLSANTRHAVTVSRADSPYLTVEDAAQYTGFPKKRIYNLTSRGEIPHRKQDGRLLFKRAELDAWMDQFYVGPPGTGPARSEDL